ncbi:neprilysin-2-like [Contarinia nasturtii]|uniref:neprilysin-2-like n=1 Tax=Contarinia nasturtii TaxID=265458 RepID=UPI0012D39700|nr:neprilysin-2-like [Contarinia nasturtii]XP_031639287.1 neprilysin-2-like [Contarinia nasturtii]
MLKLCLFAILALTGIAISNCKSIHSYQTFPPVNKTNECDNVCQTPGCIHEASRILGQMDESVDPCNDFYSFACGKFVKETIIPDEKAGVTPFSIVGDKLQEQLRSLLREKINPNDSPPFNLAKKLYKACMNKTQIEAIGLKPLRDITDRLGGWPVVKGYDWNTKSDWSWTWAVKEFRKYGFSMDYIFDLSIGTDFKNSTVRVLAIDQAALGLSREYLTKGFDDKIVKAYYEYMVDMAVIYGADRRHAERELKESLQFEMKLANISSSSEERRNYTALYNPYTLRDVQKMYPYIQWVAYINALMMSIQSVNENEVIVVSVPSYFKKLGQLLQDTPKRTIANYMMWRITSYSSFFLTSELRNRQLIYRTAVNGIQEQGARWKECTDLTKESLPMAVGALYVRKHFQQDSKAAAMDMVNRIRNEMELILNDAKWMDDETRQSALNKLKAMSTYVGYPDEMMNDSKIEEYHKNVEIDENNYLLSYLNLSVFGTDLGFKEFRKPYIKTDWTMHSDPAIVNAFYSSISNSIEFPAGVLQGNFFSSNRPTYLNYGGIGMIIGHEITHGFDDQGSQFDLNGNLVDWWKPETKVHYLEKAKCIIEQYGNYTEPLTGLKLNGINTQGENIADNGGIKETYLAYRKWQKENDREQRLPGLNYTAQQMFWLSAAQTWCNSYRPESIKSLIIPDVHSPGQFRVLGPLRNRQEFADDFNCPMGSPMNPAKKCEVW